MKKDQDIAKVIVSSRVRLARNLDRVPFKTTVSDAFESVASSIKKHNSGFMSARIDQLDPKVATALFEQHLISRELLANKKNGMIVTKDAQTDKDAFTTTGNLRACIMLGEEDHIRIQFMTLGLNLKDAFVDAKRVADSIARDHKIAHSPELGYLTGCPTNLGTAMRASIMMFLPALTKSGQMQNIIRELRGMHITVRGVYGEGSEASGYMYQISNQACLGMAEEQILGTVEEVAMKLARIELELQTTMYKDNPDEITNQVMRSLGLLTHAHMISSDEAVELIAWLKFGDCLGIVRFKPRILDDLFFVIQPATLSTQNEKASEVFTRDKMRAKKIAEILKTSRMG